MHGNDELEKINKQKVDVKQCFSNFLLVPSAVKWTIVNCSSALKINSSTYTYCFSIFYISCCLAFSITLLYSFLFDSKSYYLNLSIIFNFLMYYIISWLNHSRYIFLSTTFLYLEKMNGNPFNKVKRWQHWNSYRAVCPMP